MPVKVMVEPVYGFGPAIHALNMLDIDNYGARHWIDWARKALILHPAIAKDATAKGFEEGVHFIVSRPIPLT